jgi:hypothetical protein
LGVQEADYHHDSGRRFQVLRPRYHWQQSYFGYSVLRTDNPFRDRIASVNAFDIDSAEWQNWRLRAQWLQSRVQQTQVDNNGDLSRTEDDGNGQWLSVDFTPSTASQHGFEFINYGADLQLRDLGYLQRSDLRKWQWQSEFLLTDFAEGNLVNEMGWGFRYANRHNQREQDLGTELEAEINLRNKPGDMVEFGLMRTAAGINDEISRGHGDWARDTFYKISTEFNSARRGDGTWHLYFESDNDGLRENFYGVVLTYKHFFGETFNTEFKTYYFVTTDWLYWQHDNVFAHYQHTRDYHLGFSFNWFPYERQEWRLKTQWASTVARVGHEYLLLNEVMQASGLASDDLIINTFGLQLRYRYRLGNLSDVFVVYSRGGYRDQSEQDSDPQQLLNDALQLRDADQLLIKWRLQF